MPDGWVKLPHLQEGWGKGVCVVQRLQWSLPEYVWYGYGKQLRHGGFPDPVSCAVACELATGGCTDGHA